MSTSSNMSPPESARARTTSDVPIGDRERIRDHIEEAIGLATEHDLGFLAYLLRVAHMEAHWTHDLRAVCPNIMQRWCLAG